MGPLNPVSPAPAAAPARGAAPPPVFGKPLEEEGRRDGFQPSPELKEKLSPRGVPSPTEEGGKESKPGKGLPAFDFGEPPATAEEKANPFRQGGDLATNRANRKKDQELVDHVCGKGCGCSTAKAGGGDDPLKALEERDAEVRQHEQEHLSAAGEHARGGPEFETVTASNGRQFAVGGKVQVDVSETDDPQKTVAKMEKIQRAALAPTNPSAQDRKVATEAADKEQKARGKVRQSEVGGPATS